MIIVVSFVTFVLLPICGTIAVDDSYLNCMCEVESNGCATSSCSDNGCGYFQLTEEYYTACSQPTRNVGEPLTRAWKRCANNLRCSKACVNNYVMRMSRNCQSSSKNVYARVHAGGPDGCTSLKATEFANKVDACLGRKKK